MTASEHTTGRHARVLGSPGERPRFAGLARTAWPLFAVVFAAGYLIRATMPWPALSPTLAGMLCLVLAVILAAAVSASRTRLEAFLKGARGEENVARALSFLPADYTVFHGLATARVGDTLRGLDIDHVVVGPTGVYVVETKNWSGEITLEDGRILYDGRPPSREPVEQVVQAARALRPAIQEACGQQIALQPVLCFAADSVAGDRNVANGTLICNARAIAGVIQQRGEDPLPLSVRTTVCRHLEQLLAEH